MDPLRVVAVNVCFQEVAKLFSTAEMGREADIRLTGTKVCFGTQTAG
jgi:hypothetical protein